MLLLAEMSPLGRSRDILRPSLHLPLAASLVRHLVTPGTEGVDLPSRLIQDILNAVSSLRPELVADVLLQQAGRTSLRPLAKR